MLLTTHPVTARRRRRAARAATLALAGLALASFTGRAAEPSVAPLHADAFDTSDIQHLARDKRIAVASYRIGLLRAAGTHSGLDEDTLHGIAERAYADLVRRLRATDREVVPAGEVHDLPEYKAVASTRSRMYVQPLGDGQELLLIAPEEHDVVLTPLDAPVASVDPAAADNLRVLGTVSAAINAVVIVPTVVVETGPQGLAFAPRLTSLAVFHASGRSDGESGQAALKERVAIAGLQQLDEDGFEAITVAANRAFAEAAARLKPR